jgi:putative component of membrane protein insertase Oxa1/YidC/SpoIIIJ protein YidD
VRSGCALFLLRRDDAQLGADQPALLSQLATCRDLWSFELRDEVRPGPPARNAKWTGRPGAWIVSFYRRQIGPAIGHRCSLQPSCSAYFLEASQQHGLLGVPLIADRLVREPGVVSAAERPVDVNGSVRYADPLTDHVRTAKESAP